MPDPRGLSSERRDCDRVPGTIEKFQLADRKLARRVELAEIGFCALASVRSGPEAAVLDVGGGRALFAGTGSFVNKVLGLGLQGPVTDAELDRLEAFYAERGSAAPVEFCPVAEPDLAPRLAARGFVVQAFENQLARGVGDWVPPPAPPGIDVRVAETEDEGEAWIRCVAEGFAAGESAEGAGAGPVDAPTFEACVAGIRAFAHPAMRRYLAFAGGEPVGGIAAWHHEGVAGIAGAGTPPRFRRRGVQTALGIAAMVDARGRADLAIATTAPGSISQRNFQRLGFQILYSRVIFVKPPPATS